MEVTISIPQLNAFVAGIVVDRKSCALESTQQKVEAELMKQRYLVGMTNDEASEVLGISPRTAK